MQIYILILLFALVTCSPTNTNQTTIKPIGINPTQVPETSDRVLYGVLIACSVAGVLVVFVIIAIIFRMRNKENNEKLRKEGSILGNIVEDQID